MFCICHVQSAYSESYTLDVGESVTISQSAYGGGYIDNVGLADYIDPHLSFSKNYNGTATITVNSYFDYAATVKLVFIEKYTYLGHTRASTYYRDVVIKCKYQQPTPNKKPTKVSLPERIRIPVYNGGARDYIIPILEPYGAKGTEYYWYSDQGTAVFAARGQSDGSCWVTGRSPGVGRISVVVDDDWTNLIAHAVLEIVDPNNLPPNAVFLPNEIEISIGHHTTIEPILVPDNTSTSFSWKSDNADVASVSYGKVTGVKEGTAIISVVTANELTATCKVKVVRQNGKDDEEVGDDNKTTGIVDEHEYVDLGLSVKWASCNMGATSPEEYGNYYAWGETNTKSTYSWDNYKYYTGDILNLRNIGNDIKKTTYDAAYVNWSNNWRLPTEVEVGELVSKCTFEEYSQNGVDGFLVTGPNGASIFFPRAGQKVNAEFRRGCYYWTSNLFQEDDMRASSLEILKNKDGIISPLPYSHIFRYFGIPIRPVTDCSEEPQEKLHDGDINADGVVNVSDYIGIANHILGSTPADFNEKAADVNEDQVVNVSDYIGVANIILTGSPFGGNNVKAARVKAKVTDLNTKDNVIYVEPIGIEKGTTQATLSFQMKNTAAIRGFQFDLYLPEGVTAVKNAKGRIQGSLSKGRLPEDDEHTLTLQEQADGAIRFLCGSQYDETFTGTEGEIATLSIEIAEDMAAGNYPIVLKNMRLSETDISKFYDSDNVETTLTVKDETDLPYISIESFTIDRGEKAKLMIDLINSNDEIRVINFNYKLPNGLHVIDVGSKMDRAWWAYNESEGIIGVRSSSYYSPIEGIDGPVLEMDLEADLSFIGGSIILSNILLLKLDETEYSQPDLIYSLKGDAIKDISNFRKKVFAPLYNLSGQRVAHPRKGIYIQGGEKVLVK